MKITNTIERKGAFAIVEKTIYERKYKMVTQGKSTKHIEVPNKNRFAVVEFDENENIINMFISGCIDEIRPVYKRLVETGTPLKK